MMEHTYFIALDLLNWWHQSKFTSIIARNPGNQKISNNSICIISYLLSTEIKQVNELRAICHGTSPDWETMVCVFFKAPSSSLVRHVQKLVDRPEVVLKKKNSL